MRNSVNIEGVKLDIRGDGGYVVGPGSIHPNGVAYEWLVSPEETAFAPFPDQLSALIGSRKKTKDGAAPPVDQPTQAPRRAAGLEAFLLSELEEAQAEIAEAAIGQRNDTLFTMAARMARHVSGGGTTWEGSAKRWLGRAAAPACEARPLHLETVDFGQEPTGGPGGGNRYWPIGRYQSQGRLKHG